jgi:hypothetical protein
VTIFVLGAVLLAGCGGGTTLLTHHQHHGSAAITVTGASPAPSGGGSGDEQLAQPTSTKNTTRFPGSDPIADAAQVALAVFPSATAATRPAAVALAPSGDWEAAIAASVLMASPIHAPLLFSDGSSLPPVSQQALKELAPTGANQLNRMQVIRVGDGAPAPAGEKASVIHGSDPYTIAANIDKFIAAIDQRPSINVVIASSTDPAYAMPAAGWAAESGEPILFVDGATIPAATRQALLAHQRPHLYVLGPPSVIPDSTLVQLRRYGSVKRIEGNTPAANAIAFARYRDPPCPYAEPCAHVPGSFGWAIDSPGHGYILINASRTLDAAAAAPLSGSGDFGPELLTNNPTTLPSSVLNYFLNYATPGYNQEGPTAASFNHGWVIGDTSAISYAMQAQMDQLLEVVPVPK